MITDYYERDVGIMNSNGATLKKKAFCYGLVATLFSSMLVFPIHNDAYAQNAWQSGRMLCTLGGSSVVDFGDISGLLIKEGRADSDLKPTCTSDFYQMANNSWFASGSVCVGIESLESGQSADPRYLYLDGNPASEHKLMYNYYLNNLDDGARVGDGVQVPGVSLSTQEPWRGTGTPSGPMDVNLWFNLFANFNFNQPNLPAGKYSNQYKVTLRSGAGGGSVGGRTSCANFPDVSPPVTITVTARVLPSCQFRIKRHINFGMHTRLNANIVAYGELGVVCNLNAPYEIKLDGGRNKSTTDRRMSKFSTGSVFDDTKTIGYDLYLPNTQMNWGNTEGVDTYKGIATGAEQTIRIDGKINPQGNFTPEVGNYRDNVVATIVY